MRMSELSETCGVAVPTIKYYIREGLLPPGERTSATQASYDEAHVKRIRLIRALIDIGGLPVATAARVLAAVDDTDLPLSHVFGVAQLAISHDDLYAPVDDDSPGLATVTRAAADRGWQVTDNNPGRQGAARVLDAYAALGYSPLAGLSPAYLEAAELIARADLEAVAERTAIEDMAETVVVGTVLGDALVAALRRIAQEHVAVQLFAGVGGAGDE
jgi:DNA-binding transcriptional MerR regulator